MPRFYFDIHEGSRFVRDEEGSELDDLKAVEEVARGGAADIVRDKIRSGELDEVTVEARDEHGKHVYTITVFTHTDRHRTRKNAAESIAEAPV